MVEIVEELDQVGSVKQENCTLLGRQIAPTLVVGQSLWVDIAWSRTSSRLAVLHWLSRSWTTRVATTAVLRLLTLLLQLLDQLIQLCDNVIFFFAHPCSRSAVI